MEQHKAGQAGKVSHGIPYEEKTDLTGTTLKVVDFDNYDLPFEGQLMFELTKRGERQSSGWKIGMTKDAISDVCFGIPTVVDINSKRQLWHEIKIDPIMTLDLSIPMDRKKAIVILRSTICEGSPNLSQNIKLHAVRVHDADKAAQNEIKRITEGQRAVEIAKGLQGEALMDMGRNLGLPVSNMSFYVLTAEVLKSAQKDPIDFLRIYENPNRERLTVLKRALETQVVIHDAFDGYMYNGRPLGHSEPEVFEYFGRYTDIFTSIDMRSKAKLGENVKPSEPKVKVSDSDAEILALKRQLEDMRLQLQDKSAAELRADNPDLVVEFEALKKEADAAGVKPLHVYKPTAESMEKLKVAINKKKQPA